MNGCWIDCGAPHKCGGRQGRIRYGGSQVIGGEDRGLSVKKYNSEEMQANANVQTPDPVCEPAMHERWVVVLEVVLVVTCILPRSRRCHHHLC